MACYVNTRAKITGIKGKRANNLLILYFSLFLSLYIISHSTQFFIGLMSLYVVVYYLYFEQNREDVYSEKRYE